MVGHRKSKEKVRKAVLLRRLCSAQTLQLGLTLVTPCTVAHQPPLSVEFSRLEYWRGLPFPSPGDLNDPGLEPASLRSTALAGRSFTINTTKYKPI